jgi:hypothetical protein
MDISECPHPREVEMRKHLLLLTTTAAILTCGVIAASAQGPDTIPAGPMMQQRDQYHGGMMGHGMMGQGRGHCMAMRITFSLMDADGDGTVSLQEWQAAHERIFKAMDADHDGRRKWKLSCMGISRGAPRAPSE